jgi:uncharacterized protein (DUF1786 family)
MSNTTAAADMTVANTIAKQLGFWTRARIGCREMVGGASELRMHLGRGRKVIITLDADDTYTVAVGAVRKRDFVPTWIESESMSGVYADSLSTVVESLVSRAFA